MSIRHFVQESLLPVKDFVGLVKDWIRVPNLFPNGNITDKEAKMMVQVEVVERLL
jgi:hypothetical protein